MSARTLALTTLLAIMALHALWYGWLLPPERVPLWLPITLAWLPALPALASWLRGSRLAPLWAGIACLLYFSHGVMEAWSDPMARTPALLEIALAVVCILAAGWPGLKKRRAGKRPRTQSSEDTEHR